jgi:hypothetical protein
MCCVCIHQQTTRWSHFRFLARRIEKQLFYEMFFCARSDLDQSSAFNFAIAARINKNIGGKPWPSAGAKTARSVQRKPEGWKNSSKGKLRIPQLSFSCDF